MSNNPNDRPPNFRGPDGRLRLMRCFVCGGEHGRENWALAVHTGECAFCGWTEPGAQFPLPALEAEGFDCHTEGELSNDADEKTSTSTADEWNELLGAYRQRSIENVKRIRGGVDARVCESSGVTLVMDNETHRRQIGIQTELAAILPTHRQVIYSKPDAPGEWQAGHYIDLCVGHYETVIQRMRLAVDTHLPE